jgi:hypothetical protein
LALSARANAASNAPSAVVDAFLIQGHALRALGDTARSLPLLVKIVDTAERLLRHNAPLYVQRMTGIAEMIQAPALRTPTANARALAAARTAVEAARTGLPATHAFVRAALWALERALFMSHRDAGTPAEGDPEFLTARELGAGAARYSQVRCARQGCKARAQADGRPLERCGRCRCVHYCSTECQRADWVQRHRSECAKMQAHPGLLVLTMPSMMYLRLFSHVPEHNREQRLRGMGIGDVIIADCEGSAAK